LLAVSGVVSAAASAWAIPQHGLQGAAEANLLAALVQLAGMGLVLWRIDRQLAPTLVRVAETASAHS